MSELFMIKRLDKLFADNFKKKSFAITGNCHICRRKSKIEIVRTSGGYGLNGGMLHSQNKGRAILVCTECFNLTAIEKPPTVVKKTDLVYKGFKSGI